MESFILELIHFFKQFSYWGIIVALSIEFVPAEVILPLVGYWVHQGDLQLWLAIAAGCIGGTFGPLTLYALGRFGGRPLIVKYGKYILIRESSLNKADQFFDKYGAGVAFFARFIPGIRTVISIPCGIAKMNVWTFTLYTFLAMIPITCFYIFIGYSFGPEWKKALPYVQKYSQPLLILLILSLVLYVLIKYCFQKKIHSDTKKP